MPSGHLQLLCFGEVVGLVSLPQLLEEFTVLISKPVWNPEVFVFVVQSHGVESHEVVHMGLKLLLAHLKANLSVGMFRHWLVNRVLHLEGVVHHHGHVGGSLEDLAS